MNIDIHRQTLAGREHEVIVLSAGDALAEVWPELGGNCVRWSVAGAGELLYAPPLEELAQRTTRGGIPVLFPFPNRIRDGRFQFAGQTYQLPLNDSTGRNAIHGFSPRVAWEHDGATTSLRLGPLGVPWPGDLELQLRWHLEECSLRVDCRVVNHGDLAAPFGLGFHPYFAVAGPEDRMRVPADGRWELVDSLPTGRVVPVEGAYDLREPRRVSDLQLDDVYTSLGASDMAGQLMHSDGWTIDVRMSAGFREVVVFTPTHRQAICIEPYTCPTDAANLDVECGWKILGAGENWDGWVEYRISRE